MSPFRGLAAGMIASFLALAGCTSEDRQSAEGAASDGVSPAPSASRVVSSPSSLPSSRAPALTWGAAQHIADRQLDPDAPTGLLRVRGRASTAVWEVPEKGRYAYSRIEVSSTTSHGHWGRPATVVPRGKGSIGSLDLALGPAHMAALAWNRTDDPSVMVRTRTGPDARWGRAKVLGRGGSAQLAMDAHGVISATWLGNRGITAARRIHGRWEQPQILGRYGGDPDIAVSKRGDVAVAWPTEHGVGVAVRRSGTKAWSTPTFIRSSIAYPGDVGIAIGDHGRALVMWVRSEEEADYASRYIGWAQSTPATGWSNAGYLDVRPRRDALGGEIDLSMNPRGQAVAVWTSEPGVRATRFDFQHGWADPMSPARDAYGPTAFMTDSGTALIVLNNHFMERGRDWGYQQGNGGWAMSGALTKGDPLSSDGHSQRLGILYYVRPHLIARTLEIPSHGLAATPADQGLPPSPHTPTGP